MIGGLGLDESAAAGFEDAFEGVEVAWFIVHEQNLDFVIQAGHHQPPQANDRFMQE